MFEAYSHSNHEGLIAASCIEKEVRFGSIASIWRPARYFRSIPINGHREADPRCLGGANN